MSASHLQPDPLGWVGIVDAATEEDIGALLELEERSYSHPWTRRNFEGELRASFRSLILVLRDPRLLFLAGRGIGAYCAVQVVADELHVLNLAVGSDMRRQGVGRWLLAVTLAVGRRRGARRAFLEVRASNQPAIALYRSLGFGLIQTRRDYYSRPREDALVLAREGLELQVPPPFLLERAPGGDP